MLRFCSPEWIDALDVAARADGPLRQATAGVHLVVAQEVSEGDETARWHIVLDDGAVAVRPGPAEDADLTFAQDRATAAAINRGDLSARTAFVLGRVRVGGDIGAALRHAPALAALDDLFASVRAETEY